MNVHQRGTSAENDNQADRVIRCVDTSPPLSPATLSLPTGFMKNMAMVARIEVRHSPEMTWLQAMDLSPRNGDIPRVISQLPGVGLIILDRLCDSSCSYWNTYPGYGLAFPACNAPAKTTIHGLIECLIHHHGIPQSIVSDQATSQQKKCGYWPCS